MTYKVIKNSEAVTVTVEKNGQEHIVICGFIQVNEIVLYKFKAADSGSLEEVNLALQIFVAEFHKAFPEIHYLELRPELTHFNIPEEMLILLGFDAKPEERLFLPFSDDSFYREITW